MDETDKAPFDQKAQMDKQRYEREVKVILFILERAVDGAPSQIPRLKFLTPQAPLSPNGGHDLGNRMKILFNMFSFLYL